MQLAHKGPIRRVETEARRAIDRVTRRACRRHREIGRLRGSEHKVQILCKVAQRRHRVGAERFARVGCLQRFRDDSACSLQHSGIAPASFQELEKRAKIGAAHAHFAGEREALGCRQRIARRQLLIDELSGRTTAGATHSHHVAAHALEHRLRIGKRLLVAAAHDRERALCGAFGAAGDGRIDKTQAGRGSGLVQLASKVNRSGATPDKERSRRGGFEEAARTKEDGAFSLLAGDRHDDGEFVMRKVRERRGRFDGFILRHRVGERGSIEIVLQDAEISASERCGHAAAHIAGADKADDIDARLQNKRRILLRTPITAISAICPLQSHLIEYLVIGRSDIARYAFAPLPPRGRPPGAPNSPTNLAATNMRHMPSQARLARRGLVHHHHAGRRCSRDWRWRRGLHNSFLPRLLHHWHATILNLPQSPNRLGARHVRGKGP